MSREVIVRFRYKKPRTQYIPTTGTGLSMIEVVGEEVIDVSVSGPNFQADTTGIIWVTSEDGKNRRFVPWCNVVSVDYFS